MSSPSSGLRRRFPWRRISADAPEGVEIAGALREEEVAATSEGELLAEEEIAEEFRG